MPSPPLSSARLWFVAIVSVAYWALLTWQQLHDGVPSHSFLARDDMPAISNWWGAIVLPVVTYFLSGRVLGRLATLGSAGEDAEAGLRAALVGGAAALLCGGALAAGFATGRSEVSSALFMALPLVALLLPVYRAEYVLGFIFGLTLTFGAVLPTIIAGVVAAMSVVLHLTVRRLVQPLFGRRGRVHGEG